MANNEKETEKTVSAPTNSVKSAKTSTKPTKQKKDAKPRKSLGKMAKETMSELKKVSWPTFPKVVRQTGVVITVVLVFALVLLGFDTLFSLLYKLLVTTIS